MQNLKTFIRKERLYILLLILIVLLNVLMAMPGEEAPKAKAPDSLARVEQELVNRAAVEKIFSGNRHLALMFNLVTLLILALILLGLVADGMLASLFFSGKKLDIETHRPERVGWNLWDVAKVAILFLFFGYMLVLIESFLIREFPMLKDDNFRMMLNSSILDILTIVFIMNFVLFQHREKLISLGISARNLLRNIFYGVIGYIAAVPMFVVTLIVIAAVINIIKYVPEKQPIVELFMKEKDAAFLMYSSLFAAVVGPFIEELFFRGFMYAALRKYAGIFGAMALSSVAFAALHTHLVGFLPIMLLGMVLAYLYEKTGTLVAPITVHMIHNFSMVLFVFLLKQLRV